MTKENVKVYCPYCPSAKPLWKAGHTEAIGKRPRKQRYVCKLCRKATVNPRKTPLKIQSS